MVWAIHFLMFCSISASQEEGDFLEDASGEPPKETTGENSGVFLPGDELKEGIILWNVRE